MLETGTVGPIVYNQDNSGYDDGRTITVAYTPGKFGAPNGAKIYVDSIVQSLHIHRGKAEVRDFVATEDAITFDVYTQDAGGFPVGHHSGAISVSTSFRWYFQS